MKNQRRASNSSLERVNELELKLKEMEEVEEDPANSHLQQKKTQVRNKLMNLKIKLDTASDKEKDDYIGEIMETALYAKTGKSRNPQAALDTYSQIIQLDRENPDAYYRYAFLHYSNRHWLKAIDYFQRALDNQSRDKSNLPLAQDQVIKARLFIGYCAAQIAKKALQEANELDTGIFDLPAEGISIQDLSNCHDTLSRGIVEEYLVYYVK
ncbi:tetratricopeptide repeat protein [Paenisporosarcina sp. TG20]|uniref:tetratricopeptide repeat protein n=1 Tax=Paenisporosarcina sp. TG20 TaxID=1211706 RepID=UPI00030585D8|nr:tetratricopeptide repeat protein [Paenisporosarcina sp. TG20]